LRIDDARRRDDGLGAGGAFSTRGPQSLREVGVGGPDVRRDLVETTLLILRQRHARSS
jgi:hypothetical protein